MKKAITLLLLAAIMLASCSAPRVGCVNDSQNFFKVYGKTKYRAAR